MSQISSAKPPRLAVWLLDLFTPPSQSEAIPGDLFEEFTTAVSTSGSRTARRWYWRQVVNTVAHLMGREFRTSPWAIVATALGGYLLLIGGDYLVYMATGALLTKFQIYHYLNARLFWWIYAVAVGRVIYPMFIGWMLAAMARKMEMATAATLSTIVAVLGVPGQLEGGGLLSPLLLATVFLDKIHGYLGPYTNLYVMYLFMLGLLPPIALFVGAVIRRESSSPGGPPVAA